MSHPLAPTRARTARHGLAARLAQRLAASLMLLAAIGTALPSAAAHHDDHGPAEHQHEAPPVQPHQAGFGAGLVALWSHAQTLAHDAWSALRGPERCSDCNLTVGDGCRCECYSGGYNPDDPACSW